MVLTVIIITVIAKVTVWRIYNFPQVTEVVLDGAGSNSEFVTSCMPECPIHLTVPRKVLLDYGPVL